MPVVHELLWHIIVAIFKAICCAMQQPSSEVHIFNSMLFRHLGAKEKKRKLALEFYP